MLGSETLCRIDVLARSTPMHCVSRADGSPVFAAEPTRRISPPSVKYLN